MVYVQTDILHQKAQIEIVYKDKVTTAIDDATVALKLFVEENYESNEVKKVHIDAAEVVNTFFTSYHYGFNVIGKVDKIKMDQYVLALVLVGYDGFYVYGCQNVVDEMGIRSIKPILSEKKPYLYKDNMYSMAVTLGDDMLLIENVNLAEEVGLVSDMTNLPLGIDPIDYDWQRQKIIVDSITEALYETVNLHNRYVRQLGNSYEFHIPYTENASFADTIDDVGLLAIVQGQPLGRGDYLEIMSYTQGEVVQTGQVMAYEDTMGRLYYCDHEAFHTTVDTHKKTFSTPMEAAKEGYYPCHLIGKE